MQRTAKLVETGQKIFKTLITKTKKSCEKIKTASNVFYQPNNYRVLFEYNAQVARELIKQVWIQERLKPPSVAEIKYTYRKIPQYTNISYFYSLSQKEWIRLGIFSLQVYGFFKIGEIIGRRHIVGYKI
ncbi:hypothetical protein PNEG_01279 [Pneumocystis murina B123]|uniref:ATP synthase subunit g, mitochondrial n=1 Tax=Pneumocystis murina (strain B123) TaxID=1069680 RepID=M7PJD5_PNEMU|nr:hypothetical protein PNEG_01279 [Pneumocystis murina B123]EMR10574.1 hypothetical protein PNEG_01279 [Pneumocystis murina B123]